MTTAALSALIIALANVAPGLVAEALGVLHTQGHITASEVAAFLLQCKGTTGASFFPTLPAVAGPPV
jgi:hypothetical protein